MSSSATGEEWLNAPAPAIGLTSSLWATVDVDCLMNDHGWPRPHVQTAARHKQESKKAKEGEDNAKREHQTFGTKHTLSYVRYSHVNLRRIIQNRNREPATGTKATKGKGRYMYVQSNQIKIPRKGNRKEEKKQQLINEHDEDDRLLCRRVGCSVRQCRRVLHCGCG